MKMEHVTHAFAFGAPSPHAGQCTMHCSACTVDVGPAQWRPRSAIHLREAAIPKPLLLLGWMLLRGTRHKAVHRGGAREAFHRRPDVPTPFGQPFRSHTLQNQGPGQAMSTTTSMHTHPFGSLAFRSPPGRASIGRWAELDVPAIDTSSHCSSASSQQCVRVFARRLSRCFRQCSLVPTFHMYTVVPKFAGL